MNKTEHTERNDITRTEVASGSNDSGMSFVNITGSEDTRPLISYAASTGKQILSFRGVVMT